MDWLIALGATLVIVLAATWFVALCMNVVRGVGTSIGAPFSRSDKLAQIGIVSVVTPWGWLLSKVSVLDQIALLDRDSRRLSDEERDFAEPTDVRHRKGGCTTALAGSRPQTGPKTVAHGLLPSPVQVAASDAPT